MKMYQQFFILYHTARYAEFFPNIKNKKEKGQKEKKK